jgi:RNA polymerase sigma factor (sigma-70 family)
MRLSNAESDSLRWQQWMAQSLAGDATAYRLLLGELYGVVEAYLRRILGESPALEDCVQECIETLHRNRHSYDPNRPFRPWFFTLVRYKAIDFLRRDRTRRTMPLADDAPSPSRSWKPEYRLDAEVLLARLKPIYRDAIVLTKLNGYTTAEAAAMAGVSGVAMRTRIHRGLRELAKLLDRDVIS